MVIDTHVHLMKEPGYREELIRTVRKLGIDRIVLFSAWPGDQWATNEQVMEAHVKYPDIVIPFYFFRLGTEKPAAVDKAHRDGYRGLKILNPTANYNDESFFPVWERCEELGLVVLFHTGIVARSPEQVRFDIDTSRMKVIYLDRIARKFQKMTMFVAHLGNPDYGEACMMCRWHANMYFDLSGSTLKKKKPKFFQEMLWWGEQKIRYRDEFGRGPWEKILFGTDVTPKEMPETMDDYKRLFKALELRKSLRKAVMGGTAAKLLGIEE
ncbi:MAG TPA: amidohydrolase family protein [Spirochaetia bacterium]|nr:amidohydrolase family protein [Spirochaetia bacterium]